MIQRHKASLLAIATVLAITGCNTNADKDAIKGETSPMGSKPELSGVNDPLSEKTAVEFNPADMVRVDSRVVQPLIQQGVALLVCAYDSDEKCEKIHLEGAIPYSDFQKRLPSLDRDQMIVFYCS